MSAAIRKVYALHGDTQRKKEKSVDYQLVELPWGIGHKQDDEQTGKNIENSEIGKGRHPLMGDDGGIEGYAEKTQHERQHRSLEHPVGCHKTAGGKHKLGIEEPQTKGLRSHKDNGGKRDMDDQRGGEHQLQPFLVTTSELKSQETPRCRTKRT